MSDKLAMGIDIGGSHITCQLFDITKNRLVPDSKIRIAVNGNGSKDEILESWVKAIRTASGQVNIKDLAGIGFAMPGPFDYLNGIAWFDKNVDKFHHLTGVDVKAELISRLDFTANFPIRFLNDASSFAAGEANLEPVSKFGRTIALTLGTGFGTTFIKNGLPVAGEDGIPEDGFLYHIPFKESIADEYFSTRWFIQQYQKQTGIELKGVKELVKLAESDLTAKNLFNDFGKNLGNFLVSWIKDFNAECIVMGGNIAKSYFLFEDEMNKQFQKNGLQIAVHISELDEDAALIGSARLCDNTFYQKLIETKIIS